MPAVASHANANWGCATSSTKKKEAIFEEQLASAGDRDPLLLPSLPALLPHANAASHLARV